jgi:hypothetical protein
VRTSIVRTLSQEETEEEGTEMHVNKIEIEIVIERGGRNRDGRNRGGHNKTDVDSGD